MDRKKVKMFIAICAIISLFSFLVAFFVYQEYERNYIRNTKEMMAKTASEYSLFIDNIMDLISSVVKSTGEVFRDYDIKNPCPKLSSEIRSLFQYQVNEIPLIKNILFIQQGGKRVINFEEIIEVTENPEELVNNPWYQAAIATDRPVISPVYLDPKTNKHVITVSYAIKTPDTLTGVLTADMFLDDVYQTFHVLTHQQRFDVYVVDQQGNVILHPLPEMLGFSFAHPQEEYLNQYSNLLGIEPKTFKHELADLWQEELVTKPAGEITYMGVKNQQAFGYFHKIPNIDWVVVSRVHYPELLNQTQNYLLKVFVLALIFQIILDIFIYFLLAYVFNRHSITGLHTSDQLYKIMKKRNKENEQTVLLFIQLNKFLLAQEESKKEILLKDYVHLLQKLLPTNGLLTHYKNESFLFVFDDIKWGQAIRQMELFYDKVNTNPTLRNNLFLGLTRMNSEEQMQLFSSIQEAFEIAREFERDEVLIFPDFKDLLEIRKNREEKRIELLQAIDEDRIVPFFQPIYDLQTGKLAKYEVLMRISTDGDYLSPYPYILIAEENNMIEKVDLRVIEKALQYKQNVDPEDLIKLSINISGKELNNLEFLSKVVNLVDHYQVQHENIVLEITETQSIEDIESVTNIMTLFTAQGFTFSIDDFGTGFSSIKYLQNIPARYVKIDGSFIRDINSKEDNVYLVKSIINMARAFNMVVIAEFVENEEILQKLKEIGIDYGQGYHLGYPQDGFIQPVDE